MQEIRKKTKKSEENQIAAFAKSIRILTPIVCEYLLSFVICILFMWGFGLLLQGPLQAKAGWFAEHSAQTAVYYDGAATLVCIGVFLLWYRKEILPQKGKSVLQAFRVSKKIATVCILTLASVFSALFLNVIISKVRLFNGSEAYESVANLQYSVPLWFGLLHYGLLKPLEEELVFRGLAYARMRKYFTTRVSIPVSALLFGAYHGNVVQLVYAFFMGCLLAWAYEQYKSIKIPVLIHSAANLVVYLISSFACLEELLFSTVSCVILGTGTVVMLLALFRTAKR